MKKMICSTALLLLFPVSEACAQGFGVEIDRFELQAGKGDDPLVFDSAFTYDAGANAAVLKVEGGNERTRLEVEDVEATMMFARSFAGGTNLMAGARHDFRLGADMTYGVVAVEQALGSFADSELYFFLSEHGDLTGSGQVVVSLPLSVDLALEPRAGFSWSAQEIPEEAVGSGIGEVEVSVRLRQSLGSMFNVYVGAAHERLVGDTRDLAQLVGDRSQVSRVLIGAGLAF